MSTLIAAMFITLFGIYPPDVTSSYDPTTADLRQATALACTVGTLHPTTVNCEEKL